MPDKEKNQFECDHEPPRGRDDPHKNLKRHGKTRQSVPPRPRGATRIESRREAMRRTMRDKVMHESRTIFRQFDPSQGQ